MYRVISVIKNIPTKYIYIFLSLLVFISSLILSFHNANLYNPLKGFDGSGHLYYIKYLAQYKQIPPPTGWETHQPPLYYIISALVLTITGNEKSLQNINFFVLWGIIIVSGLAINKVLVNTRQRFIGMLSLAALPMLNIFPPTVSNELLNTFWIISAVVSSIFLYYSDSKKETNKYFLLLLLSLVLGIWTKITIVTIIPVIILAIFLFAKKNNKFLSKPFLKQFFFFSGVMLVIFSFAYLPIFIRASATESPSNLVQGISRLTNPRPLNFYIRLDWIPKVDMYTTQYYSLLGGAWNSFWSDGQNALTPFVSFHKKALVLWLLGFLLLPISLYGLILLRKVNKSIFLIVNSFGALMLIFYLMINIASNHYSAVRLTYEMGIVVPYSFGLATASKNKKLAYIIIVLLVIQFLTLVSFFWMLPWWYQAQP